MSTTSKIFNAFKRVTGNAMIMFFGNSGSMKSKTAMLLAREVKSGGGNVFYLDTEGNLSVEDEAFLGGDSFSFTPEIEEIHNAIKRLGNKGDLDLIILDSVGILTLGEWGESNARQKGDIKLKEAAILKDLQEWAYRKKAMAIVTTQCESDYAVDEKNKKKALPAGLKRPAVGKGGEYIPKEVWYFATTLTEPDLTRSEITAYRSRIMGVGKQLANVTYSEYETKNNKGEVLFPAGCSIQSTPALQKFFKESKGNGDPWPQQEKAEAPAPPALTILENGAGTDEEPVSEYDEIDSPLATEERRGKILELATAMNLQDDPRYADREDLTADEAVIIIDRLEQALIKFQARIETPVPEKKPAPKATPKPELVTTGAGEIPLGLF